MGRNGLVLHELRRDSVGDSMEQQEQVLKIKMFGGFSVSCDGRVALEDTGRSRKVWNLLEYLLFNRHRDLSQDNLIEFLECEEESANPVNTLKNLIYRLRMMLNSNNLPEKEYIVFKRGTYSWNPDISCEVDVEEFEEKWKAAKKPGISKEEQLQYFMDAIALYTGKFLPKSSFEEWAISVATYYHCLYLECISGAYNILYDKEDFEPIVRICNYAISIDPYHEDLYYMLITTLVALKRNKEALAAYEKITNLLYTELGVDPSDKIRNLHKQIMKTVQSVETDITTIKAKMSEESSENGAFYCDYEIFKDIYRFMARSVERTGQSVYIMLLTLSDKNGEVPPVELLGIAMERLHNTIRSSLRRGDIFARYSTTQYMVMLLGTSYENGCMVGRRIMNNFIRCYHSKQVHLTYKLNPVGALDGQF